MLLFMSFYEVVNKVSQSKIWRIKWSINSLIIIQLEFINFCLLSQWSRRLGDWTAFSVLFKKTMVWENLYSTTKSVQVRVRTLYPCTNLKLTRLNRPQFQGCTKNVNCRKCYGYVKQCYVMLYAMLLLSIASIDFLTITWLNRGHP